MLEVIDNKPIHHVMLTSCIVHASAVLYVSIFVQPKVVIWHYLLVNQYVDKALVLGTTKSTKPMCRLLYLTCMGSLIESKNVNRSAVLSAISIR